MALKLRLVTALRQLAKQRLATKALREDVTSLRAATLQAAVNKVRIAADGAEAALIKVDNNFGDVSNAAFDDVEQKLSEFAGGVENNGVIDESTVEAMIAAGDISENDVIEVNVDDEEVANQMALEAEAIGALVEDDSEEADIVETADIEVGVTDDSDSRDNSGGVVEAAGEVADAAESVANTIEQAGNIGATDAVLGDDDLDDASAAESDSDNKPAA